MLNVTIAADRRAFFIEMFMKATRDHDELKRMFASPIAIAGDIGPLAKQMPSLLIGGCHATSMFSTIQSCSNNADLFVSSANIDEVNSQLKESKWSQYEENKFTGSMLGVRGVSYEFVDISWMPAKSPFIQIITSDKEWLTEALNDSPVFNPYGQRIMGKEYLVLTKLDAARNIDHYHIVRIVSYMDQNDINRCKDLAKKYLDDDAVWAVTQYVEIANKYKQRLSYFESD